MKESNLTRREFLATASAGALAAVAVGAVPACGNVNKRAGNLAVLGGEPVITKSDRKSTRLNSSHIPLSRMPSSA